jgi:hypothetical protein
LTQRHFIVPDTQIKPGVPLEHIDWAAKAALDYQCSHIIILGDWWDMPSLSSHDEKGSKSKEGARYELDVGAGNEAFERFVHPLKKTRYWRRAQKHFLFGNHENRIVRAVENDPKFEGKVSLDDLHTPGFERHAFLEPLWLDGIVYAHYFAQALTGRAYSGSARLMLPKIGSSFVQGHRQGFDYGNQYFPTGRTAHGLVAGSYYLHDEGYMGPQGNPHWRGLVVLNDVKDGDYDIMPLRMRYLKQKYSTYRKQK